MGWQFEFGRAYNRRRDIHARFGGQLRGGIITPRRHPVIFIITGTEGQQHGYADRLRSDGIFEYFGEGQVGDMTFVRGNRAISNHVAEGKSLLLFRTQRDASLRFEGEWVCEGHHFKEAPDRNGNMRNAIVFELRSLAAINSHTEQGGQEDQSAAALSLPELRRRAYEAAKPSAPAGCRRQNVYERSAHVRAYVLARANGRCEGCDRPGPFERPDGTRYLEPHHIRRVSDGGPDHPRFVIALCPTCHRRVHAGKDGPEYNQKLLEKMPSIEGAPPSDT